MNELEIEKGVPLPERMMGNVTSTLRKMEISDSIFIAGKKSVGQLNLALLKPMRFASRSEKKDGQDGIRLWRVS